MYPRKWRPTIKDLKRGQKNQLEIKSTIIQIKNSTDMLESWSNTAEKRINEDIPEEII